MCGGDCINKATQEKQALIARTDAIIDRIGTSRDIIIPLLQALQAEFNYLRSDVLERVYERTEIDRAQLVSVSTFYAQFRLLPYGKHVIKVCIGTACHVKGAENVYDSMRRELKIKDDSITTDDGEFSIEKVACLGCCSLSPVMMVNETAYGSLTPAKAKAILRGIRDEGK